MTENTSPLSVSDELARAEAELAEWQRRVAELKKREQEEVFRAASDSDEAQTTMVSENVEVPKPEEVVDESSVAVAAGAIDATDETVSQVFSAQVEVAAAPDTSSVDASQPTPPEPSTIQFSIPQPLAYQASKSESLPQSQQAPETIDFQQSDTNHTNSTSQYGTAISQESPTPSFSAGTYEAPYATTTQNFAYAQQPHAQTYGKAKDHVAAGLLAILFGWLGAHKFYMGYNTAGFIMLGISVIGGIFTFTLAFWVIEIIAIVEGVIYLTKSQSEFEQIYMLNKREWF